MAASAPSAFYLDASAIVKIVVRERETEALVEYLGDADLVSSEVAEIEVPRAAYLRTAEAESIQQAELVLRRFHLVALDDELRHEATRAGPPDLRTLDAVHLVSCLRLGPRVGGIIVYDRRLSAAARDRGLHVVAPPARRR